MAAPSNPPEKEEKEKDANPQTTNDDEGPSSTDLVIRDNFPALKIPGTNGKPLVEGEEHIPRHPFWSSEDAINFHPDHLQTLLEDCETVFTARDKPDGDAYSAGQTFFLPANKQPRCALEALAQSIFFKHVEHLEEGSYDPKQSGANWWTLVLDADNERGSQGTDEDEEDEVAMHFDADYELEEQTTNLLLHPRVGTVTYLSNFGAPTLVLNQKSPSMDDLKKTTLEQGIDKAWLSHPQIGKHTAFDGRLLHGAPALYFPSHSQRNKGDGEEPSAKRAKINGKRYTLLVNVWLNHWVMDAGLLDEDVCAKLKTPWEQEGSTKKGDDAYVAPFSWNKVDLATSPTAVKTVKLSPDGDDPAGEDELTLCNHTVTIKYNPTMDECHTTSASAKTIAMELEKGTITLHVGDELPEADDDDDNDGDGGDDKSNDN